MSAEEIQTIEEWKKEIAAALTRTSNALANLPSYRIGRRPILGGVFGSGGFVLASVVSRYGGLDDIHFFVLHAESGFVVGSGESSKAGALASARSVLATIDLPTLHKVIFDFVEARRTATATEQKERAARYLEEQRKDESVATGKKIPRRRQRIFDECNGKCHYCGTTLLIDGPWHVEHKMPRALGGDNSPGNLVAACVPCNHAKRDTTDLEFIAKRAAA